MEAFLDYLHPHFPLHLLLLPFTYPPLQLNREGCPVSFPLSIIVPLPGEPSLYVGLGKSCLSSVLQLKGFSWPVPQPLFWVASLLRVLRSPCPSPTPLPKCCLFAVLCVLCAHVCFLKQRNEVSEGKPRLIRVCATEPRTLFHTRRAHGCFLALKEADGLGNLTLQEITGPTH